MDEPAGWEYSSLRHVVRENSQIVSMAGQQELGIEGVSFGLRPPKLLLLPGTNSLGQLTADRPALRFEPVGKPPALTADSDQSNGIASTVDPVEAIRAKPEDRARVEGNRHLSDPCLSGKELGEESREVHHLFVAVLEQAFASPVGEELDTGLTVRSHFQGVQVTQPETAAHFTAVVRVAAQVNEMAGPDRGLQQSNASTDGRRDTRLWEA
jgi:hypothetical protein